MIDESMDKEYQKQPPQPWEFRSKPAWQRFLVMIAGVVMNVVLAVAIYIGVCYTWGDSYFSNEDAKWGYNFNEAGHSLGFRDGDRLVSIDGEAVENPMVFLNSLLITEGDRRVVVERDGEQVELTLPLAELIAMRQNKGYEKLLVQRMPFLIDSVVAPTAARLRKGDEIVAMESRGVSRCQSSAGRRHGAADRPARRRNAETSRSRLRRGNDRRDRAKPLHAPHADVHLLGVDPRRHPAHGQRDRQLLGTAQTDRAAQNPDVRGAGRIHRHRQHLPFVVGLAGFLAENRLSVDHPRRDEHPADPGARRRTRYLHLLGDGDGTQSERQGVGRRAVRRAYHHPVPAALRQRKRHIPVLHQIAAGTPNSRNGPDLLGIPFSFLQKRGKTIDF